ncbi:hypothetical protein ACP275_04G147900 [Erythranthe tilingii]
MSSPPPLLSPPPWTSQIQRRNCRRERLRPNFCFRYFPDGDGDKFDVVRHHPHFGGCVVQRQHATVVSGSSSSSSQRRAVICLWLEPPTTAFISGDPYMNMDIKEGD